MATETILISIPSNVPNVPPLVLTITRENNIPLTFSELVKDFLRAITGLLPEQKEHIEYGYPWGIKGMVDILIPTATAGELIDPRTKTAADAAKAALPPRVDPLTFDLDGDGLETIGIAATNPILFDHNADGIKTGTGWVNADDGFLVRDVNGNGSIDTGRELFGDATIKSNGQTATDGFDALADLDAITNGGNGDGIVNASDTQYANLRLWRDLNQDGISQTGELVTLASQNIIGINTGITAHSQTLANGNQIADKGTFIKSNGTLGELGDVTGNLADINLASDTFHRTFTTTLNTSSVATLPDMQAANDEDWKVVA